MGLWATIHKDTDQFIGRCGLLPWIIDGVLEVEIAYLLAKPYWNQGFGAEVAQALVRYGFKELHLTRLIALTDAEHEASIRTAKRAGLVFDREIEMDGVLGLGVCNHKWAYLNSVCTRKQDIPLRPKRSLCWRHHEHQNGV